MLLQVLADGSLQLRPDKEIQKDVGLRETMTRMLLSFQWPWLRLGLESVFAVELPWEGTMRTVKESLKQCIATVSLCGFPDLPCAPALLTILRLLFSALFHSLLMAPAHCLAFSMYWASIPFKPRQMRNPSMSASSVAS